MLAGSNIFPGATNSTTFDTVPVNLSAGRYVLAPRWLFLPPEQRGAPELYRENKSASDVTLSVSIRMITRLSCRYLSK